MNAVALILDPDFNLRLERVARKMPVWVISSASNDPAVEQARRMFGDGDNVTSFFPLDSKDVSDACTQALYDIDEHHGPWSSSSPYDTLLVFGATSTDLSRAALDELGLELAGIEEHALVLRKRPDTKAAER